MLKISKSTYIVAAAIVLAAASYIFAWVMIQKQNTAIATVEVEAHKVLDAYEDAEALEAVQDIPTLIMSQSDVSKSIQASQLVDLPDMASFPRWVKNSKPVHLNDGMSYVSIVIDDVGVVKDRSLRSIEELPKEVTLAFLPYGESTQDLTKKAYDMGHEILVHLPMEAHTSASGYVSDPGPNALYVNQTGDDVKRLVRTNVAGLLDYAVGVNNHMGSLFTEWPKGMEIVLDHVAENEMLYLDSLTTSKSVISQLAKNYPQMPTLRRDVFLDHVIAEDKIKEALTKVEKIAAQQGYAIAIGHPHDVTTNVLVEWSKGLQEKNIQLGPITALIKEMKYYTARP